MPVRTTARKRFKFFWNNVAHTDAFDPSDKTNPLVSIDPQEEMDVDANARRLKDTVRVNPNEIVGIALKLSPYSGRYMYHQNQYRRRRKASN